MSVRSVAILGGGIMGCCAALEFARRGVRPVIYEMEDELLSGASRWNEGKVHLGYLYSADPSQATARMVIPGGLAFRPVIEDLIGGSIAEAVTRSDDLYLCHRDSVVSAAEMEAYFHGVSALTRDHPDAAIYLSDVRAAEARRLGPSELQEVTRSDAIVAGFRVPERSVSTLWIADRLLEAVRGTPEISVGTGAEVLGVADDDSRWRVLTEDGREGPFDCVVNALWQGRLAVDSTAGLPPPREWSHRHRLSVFLRTRRPCVVQSAVVAAGPFGDIKNYNDRDFYLSWYPAGLTVESDAILPPRAEQPSPEKAEQLVAGVASGLGALIPGACEVLADAEHITVGGGWVFAAATGALDDPHATLHGRSNFGVTRRGSYVSVDTGKYSTAPWLARRLVAEITGS